MSQVGKMTEEKSLPLEKRKPTAEKKVAKEKNTFSSYGQGGEKKRASETGCSFMRSKRGGARREKRLLMHRREGIEGSSNFRA